MSRIGVALEPDASEDDRATYFEVLNRVNETSDDMAVQMEAELFLRVFTFRGMRRASLRDRLSLLRNPSGSPEASASSSSGSPAKAHSAPPRTHDERGVLQRDFGTLMLVGRLNSFLGWIMVGICALVTLGGVFMGDKVGAAVFLLGVLLVPLCLLVVASGQLISCFVSIERNNHDAVIVLQRIATMLPTQE
jgi:hypothetical protein